jgi:glycosyltransferase involved in cell wall biosynthesis
VIPDAATRAYTREKIGIPGDAIVITMICRLAPEKGLDIALEAITRALPLLSPERRARVRIIIAGDGPMRKAFEEDAHKRGLSETCVFTGEASANDVISILGISDIFLFTSRRAAGYPLGILEAMASNCAVIASSEPLANSRMLAEGRGIVVPTGDAEQTAVALVGLLSDPALCREMGQKARDYVAIHHSAERLQRVLMRVTHWSALDELWKSETKAAVRGSEY